MDEVRQTIAVITETESKECESLYETRTAISNLFTIIEENKEIRQTFFSNETDINQLIEKQNSVINKYSKWWEKIIKKYSLDEYDADNLHLTFETNIINNFFD